MFQFLQALLKVCLAEIAQSYTVLWISGGYIISSRTAVGFVESIRKHPVRVTASVSGLIYL